MSPSGKTLYIVLGVVAVVILAAAAILVPRQVAALRRARMAANECSVIAACKTYAAAQNVFRRQDHDSDGVLEFAQALYTDEDLAKVPTGALYSSAPHKGPDLIDAPLARAETSTANKRPKPKNGYFFKILTSGPSGSYLDRGNMVLGHGFIAFPAEYDKTGRNSFVISAAGVVYQKDLGKDTKKIASEMTAYPIAGEDNGGWVICN